jgi:SAM-dependent methyltransferase
MKDIFTEIYKQNLWGSSESVSGSGSSIRQTRGIIQALPQLIKQFGIKSVLDAPCGDFNWIKQIHKHMDNYLGVDIVQELIDSNQKKFTSKQIQFMQCDITKDQLPYADLIINRDCLVHFSFHDIIAALRNMKASGSKYVLSTSFPLQDHNIDITTGEWRPINLQKAPINLPEPILLVNETRGKRRSMFSDKSLGLWELDKIHL